MGLNSKPIGTRRSSYPSGPWVTDSGQPAKSPNQIYEAAFGEGQMRTLPNPDPSNYKILKILDIGKYVVLRIKYPDCTNYEGDKIIVFKDTLLNVVNMRAIDPHFNKGSTIIARFVPTDEGWNMAVKFVKDSP